MEESVGKVWHHWITGISARSYPKATVFLADHSKTLSIYFRALGGDPGLSITASPKQRHHAHRRLREKLAGTQRHTAWAWRDNEHVYLPAALNIFPHAVLNAQLYRWLTALCSVKNKHNDADWFQQQQWLTLNLIEQYPGLKTLYQDLRQAYLPLRPALSEQPALIAARETVLQQALQHPTHKQTLPEAASNLWPVALWLHPTPPSPPAPSTDTLPTEQTGPSSNVPTQEDDDNRHQAERVPMPDGKTGLLAFRLESLFSWSEFIQVDRTTDDSDDDNALKTAQDMDVLSLSRDDQRNSTSLRFDLDLPASTDDDTVLSEGTKVPEWDFKQQQLQADHCRIISMLSANAAPCDLPKHLTKTAGQLKRQFRALTPQRIWFNHRSEGREIDLPAYLQFLGDKAAGNADTQPKVYRELKHGYRDMACLLLADLSLSTDAWINNHARIIDVIRDSLFLFGECLTDVGDQLAIYGFSSRLRAHVRVHTLKAFNETYSAEIRGRIQAISPGYYTRMGAAIRHVGGLLDKQPTAQKLLLILTDGKPNDLDAYEGRYGIEDTRHALQEIRQQGIEPFCVTIDRKGGVYLPHLFGHQSYVLIRNPSELPNELPRLYARLTGR